MAQEEHLIFTNSFPCDSTTSSDVDHDGFTFFHGRSGTFVLNLVKDHKTDDTITATVHDESTSRTYSISPDVASEGGGIIVVQDALDDQEEDMIVKDQDDRSKMDSKPNKNDFRHLQTVAEKSSQIDILVLWTMEAECANSDPLNVCAVGDNPTVESLAKVLNRQTKRNMKARIKLAIEQTNVALKNSGVDAKINLVRAYRDIKYIESGNDNRLLLDLTCYNDASRRAGSGNIRPECGRLARSNSGAFDDVFQIREESGADMVAMLSAGGQGAAWLRNTPDADFMFSVTPFKFATRSFGFARGLGYNFVSLKEDCFS